MRGWLAAIASLAGLLGAAGVGLAAIGAHRSTDPTVTTAAHFLLFHAAAMLGICAIGRDRPTVPVLLAGSTIALGVILFSGDLALRALAHVTIIRMMAPTGGMLMILGWLVAAAALPPALLRGRSEPGRTGD